VADEDQPTEPTGQGQQPGWGQQPGSQQQPGWGQQPGWQQQPPPGQGWGPPPGGGGWQQQPPPGQGWGAPPPYGYPPARSTEPMAIACLVLAIAAYVVCPVVLAVVALVLGRSASSKIAASGGWLEGESLVKVGSILAWINIGLAVFGFVAFVLLVAVSSTPS
jgi:hypothetical protein